nr:5336_t:CDS:2 [Entrophospora candida]
MELNLVDLEKKGVQHGLQIARRGFQLYSDMEFDSVERERKRSKLDKDSCEKPHCQSISESKILSVEVDVSSAFLKPLKILSTGSFRGNLDVCATLSLRPRHFGKTLFLSTLSSYYDVKNKGERFEQLFGDLYIGKNPTPLASSFLVLRLDFSGLRTNSTFEIFEDDFHKIWDKNESTLVNFKELLNAIELSGHRIYVFIDEYDAGMIEALKNESTLQPLIAHHKNSLSRTEAMESSFKQFYSRLKSVCDNGIAYVFQTGVTPIVMSEFTSGFNISTDLALREEFWDLKKDEYGGYYFNPDQQEGIFNTGNILYSVQMLTGRIKYVERYKDTSIYIKKLLRFSPDPHRLPSQTTLNLIVNNSLGKSILTESIGQLSLESRNGIEQRFRLVNIRELATDRTPSLSFLFYTGALTYQPGSSKFSFRIPNNVSKREFITESLKIHEWKQDNLTPVRQCLQILEANNDIDPSCRFVEELLLKPLKDNSIVHSNEETSKQTF